MDISLPFRFVRGRLHFVRETPEAKSVVEFPDLGQRSLFITCLADQNTVLVTDALGNRNNLLVAPVEEDQKEESSPQKSTDGPRESIGDIQISTLIVEKTDAEPNHSDDFGNNTATVGQKEAHDMRAPDAEPVATIVKTHKPLPAETKDIAKPEDAALTTDGKGSSPQSPDAELSILEERRLSHTPIPEVAATAAEVADSAAKIDREESLEATTDAETSTPPGLHNIFAALEARRLSHTPIGEVADTAAEVADSAAEIDREMVDNHEVCIRAILFHIQLTRYSLQKPCLVFTSHLRLAQNQVPPLLQMSNPPSLPMSVLNLTMVKSGRSVHLRCRVRLNTNMNNLMRKLIRMILHSKNFQRICLPF
jgi:hypothetical protein